MKILIVHNDYGKYSGEEAVVDKMAAMLGSHGYDVVLYRLSSAGRRESLRGRMEGFACGLYSPAGVRGMREALRRERPDVVNVHNLYPFISPAALFECRKAGVPVVMTVHNFRLVCPLRASSCAAAAPARSASNEGRSGAACATIVSTRL